MMKRFLILVVPILLALALTGCDQMLLGISMLHPVGSAVSQSDDGITGIGAVEMGREEIAMAMAVQRFGSSLPQDANAVFGGHFQLYRSRRHGTLRLCPTRPADF